MRNLFLICVIAIVMALTGCKTSEANYRAAYEVAKEKRTQEIDAMTDASLAKAEMPQMQAIGETDMPVITLRLYAVAAEGANSVVPKLYSVAVAKFKQLFNARSLCQRLREGGLESAFVTMDREKNYYVITGTTSNEKEVVAIMSETESNNVFKAKTPFPSVIISR